MGTEIVKLLTTLKIIQKARRPFQLPYRKAKLKLLWDIKKLKNRNQKYFELLCHTLAKWISPLLGQISNTSNAISLIQYFSPKLYHSTQFLNIIWSIVLLLKYSNALNLIFCSHILAAVSQILFLGLKYVNYIYSHLVCIILIFKGLGWKLTNWLKWLIHGVNERKMRKHRKSNKFRNHKMANSWNFTHWIIQ